MLFIEPMSVVVLNDPLVAKEVADSACIVMSGVICKTPGTPAIVPSLVEGIVAENPPMSERSSPTFPSSQRTARSTLRSVPGTVRTITSTGWAVVAGGEEEAKDEAPSPIAVTPAMTRIRVLGRWLMGAVSLLLLDFLECGSANGNPHPLFVAAADPSGGFPAGAKVAVGGTEGPMRVRRSERGTGAAAPRS